MDIPWHNRLVLGSVSPNIFCFVLFGIIRLQEPFEKKFRIGRSAESPKYRYSLAQLARFGFRVSKHFSFGFIWDYKTSRDIRKKMRVGRSAGSPKFGYSLAQLACFGFRVSQHFSFGLIWDYKTSRDIRKKKWGLGDQQEVLNMETPGHNWLVLGSESPNIFRLVLFGIIRLQETFEKKKW
jgi:hypothetical protein